MRIEYLLIRMNVTIAIGIVRMRVSSGLGVRLLQRKQVITLGRHLEAETTADSLLIGN